MKHIAIMDDNIFQEQPLIDELKMRGYKVSEANNTKELFKILKQETIDLFILDIFLYEKKVHFMGNSYETAHRGMDTGLIVARLLRHNKIYTPIILYSVASNPPDIRRITELEKDDANIAYFVKYNYENTKKLPDYIDELFETGQMKKSKWKGILGESLFIKPSIFGVGIDLKELFKSKK